MFFQQFTSGIQDAFLVVLEDTLVRYIGRVWQGEVTVFVGNEGGKSGFRPLIESFAQGDTEGVTNRGTAVFVDRVVSEVGMLVQLTVLCIILGDVFASVEVQFHCMDEAGNGYKLF